KPSAHALPSVAARSTSPVVSQRSVSGPCTFDTIEARRIASYMLRLSEQLAPSVPMPTLTLRLSMPRTSASPLPSRMLLPGLWGAGGAVTAQGPNVIVIEPYPVPDGKVGAEQAEVLKMRGRRLAVAPETDHHLRLGFLDMGMQADREIAGKRRAFAHKIVGAMAWDGRRDSGPDGFTVLCPAFQCQRDRFQRCVAGRQPQALHVFAQNRRHGVEQAGNGLKERELSDHRRQHGANAGVPIGPRARFETLNGR